jgi:hypothetical protein
LLYEKVKIQRNAISQGEVAYRERLEDVRVLRCDLREHGTWSYVTRTDPHIISLKPTRRQVAREWLAT